MIASYYNTNGLKGEALVSANKKAERQEIMVTKIFASYKRLMTASEVHALYVATPGTKPNTPLQSIRRAISNLSSKEFNCYLKMTELKTEGIYGSPEHYYKIRDNQLKLF